MAFGFPPTKKTSFAIPADLDHEKAMALTLNVLYELAWDIELTGIKSWKAWTKISIYAFGEEVSITLSEQQIFLSSKTMATQILDWNKNRRNLEKFENLFIKKAANLTEQEWVRVSNQFHALQSQSTEGLEQLDPPATKKTFLLLPTPDYWATPLLFWTNLVLFGIMAFSGVHLLTPETADIINWGGNMRLVTREGEWWRLLSSCFIHIGIVHLAVNMYGLLFIGALTERKIGPLRVLTVYFFGGLMASCASFAWNENVVSAGASGAIFALFGTFLALLLSKAYAGKNQKNLLLSVGIYVLYSLAQGFGSTGIDNAAHVGGLAAGLLLGFIFAPSYKRTDIKGLKGVLTATAIITVLLSCFAILMLTPKQGQLERSLITYQEGMREFTRQEQLGLQVFNFPETAPKAAIQEEILKRSIPYWKKNILLLESFRKLNLPPPLREQNEKILEYANLRLNHLRLLYRSLEEETDAHDDKLKKYIASIDGIIKELAQNRNNKLQ